MANITAAMVKELREMTGAGMMDCKGALNETGGDIEAAVDWLRKKGLSKAAKKSDRVAAEGLVGVAVHGENGVVVEVNSETDFVARNEEFQALVKSIALVAVEKGESDVEELKKQHYPGGAGTVADAISNAIATIGENMTLRRVASLSVPHGVIGQYVHNSVSDGVGKIGVIVALESTGDKDQLTELGRKIAMHVAAASPLALDASGLDPATVEREKNVLREKNAGKPAHVLEKIVESGLKTYYKEVTLVEQLFIHDNSKTVAQAVAESAKTVGAPVALKGFVKFVLGEGVEKQEADFAAEVAAAASGQA
ncbi:translation elongation factor Ts [Rhodoblastus acidophilus]|uniref:Elongation factor Ts n=1 Tax=Candidatus Rhodoblastus alkanivorans TaxID=2954117 RepID=A0ABS9Z731_9HYPH|nr:translation elongation factor Ts [Candidatus Rhodoblastus alkanivorans]MCI4679194.1 translation elongation factor Ts [Candidatus Rhodoblastus alkanivorans]MCI4683190.1 translation elongation factor Ts [Candidatus Rhodoblastus alkanivorans]MDI4640502.1 translation elongation factor Ts [Rhodoblastus acidophilus]